MNKYANVDFGKCDPMVCDAQHGLCRAARSCSRKLLEQEEPRESPMLIAISTTKDENAPFSKQ